MNEYDFTLKFVIPKDLKTDDLSSQIFAGGCDDAIIGVGVAGRLALNFVRESNNATEAIRSALSDIKKVIPQAKLVEIGPDLVGLSDAGEQLNMSRQYLRKVRDQELEKFPLPVHEGNPSLWHLCHLLEYFRQEKLRDIPECEIELAKAAMTLNYEQQKRRVY